jgi:hypothetical protein
MPTGLLLNNANIDPALNLPRVFELYWHRSQAASFSLVKD